MKNEILLATICAFISAIVSGIVSIITTVLVERHKEKRILLKEKREARRLCILSGEIGGGSTEALICLGISVSMGL